ncbi:MAG: lipoate protein ligase C-terminal domain-containing protein [archaeon]
MEGKNIYKVPGGKLVKVDLAYGETIQKIRITGDFFMHPEEAIETIERELVGCKLSLDELDKKIAEVVSANDIQTFGINSRELAIAIMGCAK